MMEAASSAAVDPGDLSRLHDVLPTVDVPWFPPAPGWWFLAAAAGVAAVGLAARRFASWRADAYRRQALALLQALPMRAESLPAVDALLKRAALTAFPRERVAALAGRGWRTFLDAASPDERFAGEPGRLLAEAAFAPPEELARADAAVVRAAFAAAERWIRRHDPQASLPC